MTRKTASLAYPNNPLAAMRDLQDLDRPESAPTSANSSAESSAVAYQPSSERGNQRDSEEGSADTPTGAQKPTPKPRSQRDGEESSADAPTGAQTPTPKRGSRPRATDTDADEGSSNPMADAVWAMLRQPYTADARKGPFTVSTVKIPTEVWGRLGWVATLTGQPKQEIITDALKTHFETVLKART